MSAPAEERQATLDIPEARIVLAWHEALNIGDLDGLAALSSNDVEVGGPRGTSQGTAVLREWFARAGIRLQPRQLFQRGEVVVVEQEAEWREPGTDRIAGQQVVATLFVVRGSLVAQVIRYPDLAAALRAAGDPPLSPVRMDQEDRGA